MKWQDHKFSYRIISLLIIALHLATFGPIRGALAFYAQSASYKLSAGTLNQGGRGRGGGSYTKLLLHADGATGSTTFTDETGNTVTAQGNAQIDTAQSKFSGASGLFNGGVNIQAATDNSNQRANSGNSGRIPGTQYLIPYDGYSYLWERRVRQ